jgi:hypothetical protein
MISDQDIERMVDANQHFKPAILSAKYYRDTDRIEFQTLWCTIVVDRMKIEEFREISVDDMETIYSSDVGVHIDRADVDINSAGLITYIAKQLEMGVANSF